MRSRCQDGLATVALHGPHDFIVTSGNGDRTEESGQRHAPSHVLDHRQAENVSQRFARKTGRCHASRYDGGDSHLKLCLIAASWFLEVSARKRKSVLYASNE